ncbi:hypothetical protein [Bartonella sp. HY406]|uniref:hypothetical protein n=1 Tax=Bartonella sp. HY406 TaxID=2979331 RepID=UPI0021C8D8C0|nr:hypothetical protein [Bartonella sp. HY406]UXN02609.1 hypothetical protein N6B01_08990 [Bartonella sp. HY406]
MKCCEPVTLSQFANSVGIPIKAAGTYTADEITNFVKLLQGFAHAVVTLGGKYHGFGKPFCPVCNNVNQMLDSAILDAFLKGN